MPHVIITGGSSGIGLEIARLYVARGWHVSLIARGEEMLHAACRLLTSAHPSSVTNVLGFSADVSDEAALQAAIHDAEARHGPCDVLVTSAGRVDPQDFIGQPVIDFNAQINVNFLGSVYAVRTVLEGMRQRGRGRILLISSGAALIGIPGYAGYCASKSALSAFAEALSAELSHSGVEISISFPPDTLTPQYEREIKLRPARAQRLMGAVPPWPADKVAKKIVSGSERGRRQVHFGASLTLLYHFSAFIKPFLFWRLQQARV